MLKQDFDCRSLNQCQKVFDRGFSTFTCGRSSISKTSLCFLRIEISLFLRTFNKQTWDCLIF